MLKGVNEGILVTINDFEKDLKELEKKLEKTSFFTQGTDFLLLAKDKKYYKQLEKLLEGHGHNLYLTKRTTKKEEKVKTKETIILKKKIHSGQKVEIDGNVLLLGDLNYGAELVATGDVYIIGKARGNIHAGSSGDNSRVIIALGMEVSHLKIGDLIAQNSSCENIKTPARAYAVGKNIAIEELRIKSEIYESEIYESERKKSISSYFCLFKRSKK
jgi:septum site-determining protein MinC